MQANGGKSLKGCLADNITYPVFALLAICIIFPDIPRSSKGRLADVRDMFPVFKAGYTYNVSRCPEKQNRKP
jgi:hypothetical protein